MARPGKEQLFFFASLGLTGLLGAFLFTGSWKAPSAPRGTKPDESQLAHKEVPRAPRGALADTGWTRAGREAFREPRDWLPLPPAALERPPLREPAYVPPVPPLSASLDRLGLYRTPSKVTPHQFPDEAAAEADDGTAEDEPVNAAAANAPSAPSAGAGAAGSGSAGAQGSTPAAALPSEDEELRKRFDWLELSTDPKPWYGIIENADKFGLEARAEEKVQFRRLNPKTLAVMGSGSIDRNRVKPNGIHFAGTAANKCEVLLRQNPPSQWTTGRVPALLDVIEQAMPLGAEDPNVWRRGIEHLEKIVALDPKHARSWELLADVHANLLDFEGELKTLEQTEQERIESPGLIMRRARWLARVGAKTGALQRLEEGAARFPNDRDLHLAYGRALLDEGSPDNVAKAVAQFQQAEQGSDTGDERMEVIAEVGAALLEQGQPDRALGEAKRILNVDKGSPLGMRLQGAASFALGKVADAEGDWQTLFEKAATPRVEGDALLALGIARTRLGEFDRAREDLRQVTTANPLLAGPCAAAEADLLSVTDHHDAAIARCRDALARAPDDAWLRYFAGRMLRRTGDLAGAGGELRRALDLGAAFPDLFTELGYLALLEGRAADARRYLEESLAREDRDETRLLLAHAFLLADDLGPARALFDALNAKKPSGEALLGLAYCAYKKGESPAAQAMWQQVRDDLQSAHADDKAYAAKWLATVLDLESKQVWEDTIQWHEVGNGWELDNRYSLEPRITPGAFRLGGTQRAGTTTDHWTYLKRDVELVQFFEYEVELSFGPEQQGRVGFGLAHFMGASTSQQAPQVRASLLLAVEPDGSLLLQHREHVDDAEWAHIGKVALKAGDPVRLALRRKERGSAYFQFFADGNAIGEPIEMKPWKGKTRSQVSALFFVAAPGGKKADAQLQRAIRVEFLPQ